MTIHSVTSLHLCIILLPIQYLDVGYCRLSHLPSKIFHGLTALRRLDLRGNELHHLEPFTFANLRSLDVLLLGHNPLRQLNSRVRVPLKLNSTTRTRHGPDTDKVRARCRVRVVEFSFYYSAADRGAQYCDERVCLSVCLFACTRSYLWNYTSHLQQIYVHVIPAVARFSSGGVVIRYVSHRCW